VSEPVLITYMK